MWSDLCFRKVTLTVVIEDRLEDVLTGGREDVLTE